MGSECERPFSNARITLSESRPAATPREWSYRGEVTRVSMVMRRAQASKTGMLSAKDASKERGHSHVKKPIPGMTPAAANMLASDQIVYGSEKCNGRIGKEGLNARRTTCSSLLIA